MGCDAYMKADGGWSVRVICHECGKEILGGLPFSRSHVQCVSTWGEKDVIRVDIEWEGIEER